MTVSTTITVSASSKCTEAPKTSTCGDKCVDLKADPQNCGACGVTVSISSAFPTHSTVFCPIKDMKINNYLVPKRFLHQRRLRSHLLHQPRNLRDLHHLRRQRIMRLRINDRPHRLLRQWRHAMCRTYRLCHQRRLRARKCLRG